MKKWFQGIMTVIVTALMVTTITPLAATQAASDMPAVNVDATAALAIEATTGKVLYEKNADATLPIASMTKMLSIELVLDAIKSGKIKWTDQVAVTPGTYTVSQDRSLSNVPLRQDGHYTVKELYEASLIYSANAAMMLLADHVAGSQAQFVTQMKDKLTSWGIKDATIVNATGLNNAQLKSDVVPNTPADAENTMTAKDIAQVAQHLLKDHPEVLETTRIPKATFREGTSDAIQMENWNWMLPGLISHDDSLPVDGLKTGTSDAAGDSFTGTVDKNGMRIITVVLHANGAATTRRFDQTKVLMKAVLDNWEMLPIASAGQSIAGYDEVKVALGKETTTPIAPASKLVAVVPKGTTKKQLDYHYTTVKQVKKNTIEAPIKKNTKIGTLQVTAKGDKLGFVGNGASSSTTLKTTKDDPKANVFVLMFRGIGEFFGNLF